MLRFDALHASESRSRVPQDYDFPAVAKHARSAVSTTPIPGYWCISGLGLVELATA
jgi:hypothetical protein